MCHVTKGVRKNLSYISLSFFAKRNVIGGKMLSASFKIIARKKQEIRNLSNSEEVKW